MSQNGGRRLQINVFDRKSKKLATNWRTVSWGTDRRTDARQQGGAFFTRRPRQPTNTRYKAANIENEYILLLTVTAVAG